MKLSSSPKFDETKILVLGEKLFDR